MTTLAPLFLFGSSLFLQETKTTIKSFSNGSSSFLQVTRSAIKALMGLNFGRIPSLTFELAALERLKKQ